MDKVVVFVCSDRLLRIKKVKEYLNKLQDVEVIEGEDDFDLLLQELDTNSFFSSKKVIYLESPTIINDFKEDDYKKIYQYLENPSDNILLISVDELKDNKITKALKNVAKIYKIDERNQKNIRKYIKDFFESASIKINEEDIDYIAMNSNVLTIDSELEKLYLYAISSGTILRRDLEELLVKNIDSKIYDLTSAILERDKNKIMKIYKDLLSNNEDSIRIMNNIAYKFEELLFVKDLLSKGYTNDDIASYFRVSSGRAYHMVKDSKRISVDTIKKNIQALSSLDYKIKSGLISPKIGLEMYLLD